MNKRIRNKIMKHKELEHSTMTEAAGQLSARELAGQTVSKVVNEAKTQALAIENKAEKLLEKIPFVGEAASHKLHDLSEKVVAAVEHATASVQSNQA